MLDKYRLNTDLAKSNRVIEAIIEERNRWKLQYEELLKSYNSETVRLHMAFETALRDTWALKDTLAACRHENLQLRARVIKRTKKLIDIPPKMR